jgi:hypothetical protein
MYNLGRNGQKWKPKTNKNRGFPKMSLLPVKPISKIPIGSM